MTYYLTLFDGRKKTMEEIEHIFNAMYHPDCIYIDRDGNKKNRDEMKKNHEEKLVMGSKITPLLFKLTGFDTMEVKYKLTNDEEEKVVHQLLTTDENDKIVKCKITIEAELSQDEIVRQKLLKSKFPKKKRQSEELTDEEDDNDEQGQENQNKRRKVEHDAGAPPQHKMTPAALHE
jgi:hypothetical protein